MPKNRPITDDKNARVQVLLPLYMNTETWRELCAAIDTMRESHVLPVVQMNARLRDLYITEIKDNPSLAELSDTVTQRVRNREIIPASDFDVLDLTTETLRLERRGLPVRDPTLLAPVPSGAEPSLANSPLHRASASVAMYWYHKGTATFVDFINYVLGTDVRVVNLWTTDYKEFYSEGDPIITTKIWEGGPWFPTTHVRLDISNSVIPNSQLPNLVALFYDVANYNLVLESIYKEEFHQIVDTPDEPGPVGWVPAEANIFALGLVQEVTESIESADLCPVPMLVSPLFPAVATIGIAYSGSAQVSSATTLVGYTLPVGFTATLTGNTINVSGTSFTAQRIQAYFVLENECGTLVSNRIQLQGGPFEVGGIAPSVLTPIAITPSAVSGDILSVTTVPVFGGLPAPTVSFQWYLNGVANGAATSVPDSRIATPGTWRCDAVATNPLNSATSTSNSTPVACAMPVVVQALTPSSVQPGEAFVGTMTLRNVTSATFANMPSWLSVSAPVVNGSDYTYTFSGTAPAGQTGTTVTANPVISWDGSKFVIQSNATFAGNPAPWIMRQDWLQYGAPLTPPQNGSTFTPALGQGGDVQLRQWGYNGIGVEVAALSNTISLSPPLATVNPVITLNAGQNALVVTTLAEFSSSLPLDPITYRWVKDNFVISGATGLSYSPSAAGEYYTIADTSNQVYVGTAVSNKITLTVPRITSTPAIPPSAPVGQLITPTPPTADGFPIPTLSPSWRLNGAVVSTAASYAPTLAGQLTLVWTATSIAGSASAQSNTCTVANNTCPIPAVSSGLPWPEAFVGVPYDHTVFVTDATTDSTLSGAPPWATVSITQAGSGINVRLTGIPTTTAVTGTIPTRSWSVQRILQGNFEIYANGTAAHSPNGISTVEGWNSLTQTGPDPSIGPLWHIRVTANTPSLYTPATQALFGSWLPMSSDYAFIMGAGPVQTIRTDYITVEFSTDGGATTANSNVVYYRVTNPDGPF